MSPKKYYTFMIEPDMADELKAVKASEPEMSEAAIIRQALREWLDRRQKGRKPARQEKEK